MGAGVDRIGTYAIVRKLGEGGMGTVYLARSRGGRSVAVKVARPELACQPLFRERFRAEVAAARRVGGFHTAPVVDADPDAEAPWLATAYVPGPTLSQLITAQGPMGTRQLRRLGAALAEALQAVHSCGLVHRDLKPGNIIMAEDGPRVLDFGIARAVENTPLTITGTAFGTPGFLAPEQAEGHPVDTAADVFALGAVLVAAAGGSAFGDGTPVSLMYRSVHHPPDLSAVPDPLRPIVAACLEKAPERRPSTGQLLDWLTVEDPRVTSYPGSAATPGRPGTVGVPGSAPTPRHPGAAGVPSTSGTAGAPAHAGSPAAAAGYSPTVAGVPAVPPPPPHAPIVPAVAPAPPGPPPAGPPPGGAMPAGAVPGGAVPAGAVPGGLADDPEFLAMDRKNSIVADRDGIAFDRNGSTAEFPWYAIDYAEQTADPRRTTLTVSLLLTDDSAHICKVTARNRDELVYWSALLDAVLRRFAPGL
ncbi:serine/threonine-protein kinase [Streptomyces sp. XD-27]|uniref:serine/threonine-protein kinase n=1 Tax=Streptomyces sp. XD-27 TaxID=3062779 RepID=UPI0026F42885|nr:serine/threonine-protein kinase [Streptomyces sp. XD-27]WKX71208.1 serine/threonine-protein kinase [Streptomyces sp. XD-27]